MIAVGFVLLLVGLFFIAVAGVVATVDSESSFTLWTAVAGLLAVFGGVLLMLAGIAVWLWRVAP